MEINKTFLKAKANKNQELAKEIYNSFHIPFPRLMVSIKRLGYQFVYETYKEVLSANAKNPVALFLWKLKQVRVELK